MVCEYPCFDPYNCDRCEEWMCGKCVEFVSCDICLEPYTRCPRCFKLETGIFTCDECKSKKNN